MKLTNGTSMVLLVAVAWLTRFATVGASKHYLPGVNVHSFQEGDDVKLKVNKLTSKHTQMPLDYYGFPFCQPLGGVKLDNMNLGEFLAGDRIESSPYVLKMKKDMYCEQLCVSNLGRGEQPNLNSNKVVRVIRAGYHNNWIVDNLPAASKMEDDNVVITRYWQGFPVGFIAQDNKKAYIHNHVNIELYYHKATELPATDSGKPGYRIVKFMVEPFSIKHDFDSTTINGDEELTGNHDYYLPKVARINNPIASCNPSIPYTERPHTSYSMVVESRRAPQPASGKVLFTYDVIWTEDYYTSWSHRWDVYLSMNGAVPAKVHIVSIINSMVVILALMGVFSCCVVRQLRDAVARFSDDDQEDPSNNNGNDVENTTSLLPQQRTKPSTVGWIRVYSDVFRPPELCPRLFAVACGTGAQILMATLATILCGWLGGVNPARRGSLLMGGLFWYCIMGGTNGYVASRLYKTFFGRDCWQTIKMTALVFPGIVFGTFMFFHLIYLVNGSTLAVPFPELLVLLFFWAFHAALVYCGAKLGYRQGPVEFMRPPARDSSSSLTVPPQPWTVAAPTTLIVGGFLPFIAAFVENYYMMASFWQEYYYYEFGFLLIVFFLVLATSAAVCVLFIFFQLKRENHHWWWRAFGNAGSAAVWLFGYSMIYFQNLRLGFWGARGTLGQSSLHTISLGTCLIYFLTMAVVCLGIFCMLGFVGVAASLWFHKVVFSTVKDKLGYELLSDNDDCADGAAANGGKEAVQMLDISESEMLAAEPSSGTTQDEANKQPLEPSSDGGVKEDE